MILLVIFLIIATGTEIIEKNKLFKMEKPVRRCRRRTHELNFPLKKIFTLSQRQTPIDWCVRVSECESAAVQVCDFALCLCGRVSRPMDRSEHTNTNADHGRRDQWKVSLYNPTCICAIDTNCIERTSENIGFVWVWCVTMELLVGVRVKVLTWPPLPYSTYF